MISNVKTTCSFSCPGKQRKIPRTEYRSELPYSFQLPTSKRGEQKRQQHNFNNVFTTEFTQLQKIVESN